MHIISIMATMLLTIAALPAQEYSWQKPHIEMLPNGDMRWQPEPYRYQPGEVVRYIDFENGDDANSGTSPALAWKRHPWDLHATGNAAQAAGPITYVFKGGSVYRGQLTADESGEPGNPIRLVSDPDWGDGPAWVRAACRPSGCGPAASIIPSACRIRPRSGPWICRRPRLS